MSIRLGVKLGPSFAEYCLLDTTRPRQALAFQRSYTPSENISISFKKFLSENRQYKPELVLIASQHLEKILETKLGNSVAQIVTKGFENWPLLRQNLQKPYFEMTPQRTDSLASQELIFGLRERINSQGQVLKELDPAELDFIAAKLKLMNIQKVCVHLLFADLNPVHLQKVTRYFQELGFEVFSSQATPQTQTTDEILLWRKSVLNASLSGTFTEVRSEFLAALQEFVKEDKVYFLDGDKSIFQQDSSRIASSLFGPAQALAQFYHDQEQVLCLGLEKWQFIKPRLSNSIWQSPWGPLAGQVPLIRSLAVQPTQELFVDDFSGFNWNSENMGYEPGPMSFGRGFRPMIFDFLSQERNLEEIQTWVNEAGRKKFIDHLTALKKMTRGASSSSSENIIEILMADLVDRIALQTTLERESVQTPIVLTGIFARQFLPHLQRRWRELNWQLCPYSPEIEGLSVAAFLSNSELHLPAKSGTLP